LLKDELEARSIQSKLRTSASGRISGGKPFARGALYLILRNRIYRGEIAVADYLRRRDIPAHVAVAPGTPFLQLRYELECEPSVSIIVPTKESGAADR
jgi:hypothetical protein